MARLEAITSALEKVSKQGKELGKATRRMLGITPDWEKMSEAEKKEMIDFMVRRAVGMEEKDWKRKVKSPKRWQKKKEEED